MESGAVLAGALAYASRVYSSVGMTSYAATLKAAAAETRKRKPRENTVPERSEWGTLISAHSLR